MKFGSSSRVATAKSAAVAHGIVMNQYDSEWGLEAFSQYEAHTEEFNEEDEETEIRLEHLGDPKPKKLRWYAVRKGNEFRTAITTEEGALDLQKNGWELGSGPFESRDEAEGVIWRWKDRLDSENRRPR